MMSRLSPRVLVVLLGVVLLGPLGFLHGQVAGERQPVTLKVVLPLPNAELLVEDAVTRQTGTHRTFRSPPLETNKEYTYTLVAVLKPNNYTTITRTRKVAVRGGQQVEVDLRYADDSTPDKIVIRYVPTPMEVVEAMLKMANVGKDDIVFDLGCGDGRLVVTAVEKFEAKRGVGVDIDPERIKDSKANAKRHNVEDRVEFRQADVLQIKDLSDASAIMLYMGNELNLQLRPILRKTLKPGSRIVSHRFIMGDWKPLKSQIVVGRDGEKYNLHLWIITEDDPKEEAKSEQARKELEQMAGVWSVAAVERDGKALAANQTRDWKLTITGDKYVFQASPEAIEGKYQLDPSQDPKAITATRTSGADKGKTLLGIYQLEGDELKICFNAPDKPERPKNMQAPEGSGLTAYLFKRQKP